MPVYYRLATKHEYSVNVKIRYFNSSKPWERLEKYQLLEDNNM